MKKEKMSLEKMKGVLSNVLSREEMKEVMAGSGTFCGQVCLYNSAIWYCYNSGGFCTCPPTGGGC
jgi:hypothetical protein